MVLVTSHLTVISSFDWMINVPIIGTLIIQSKLDITVRCEVTKTIVFVDGIEIWRTRSNRRSWHRCADLRLNQPLRNNLHLINQHLFNRLFCLVMVFYCRFLFIYASMSTVSKYL